MRIQVHHAKNPNFGFGTPRSFPDEYNLVAELEIEATDLDKVLEMAFRDTNHIDGDWTNNPSVIAGSGQHRSTSAGDVFVIDQIGYRCGNIGWQLIKQS